jgi:hypothetical protein
MCLSHKKQAKECIEPILQTNGKNSGTDESARRICNYLTTNYEDSVMSSLKEKQYPIVNYMNETRIAAMWENAGINFSQETIIMRHLRRQFGERAFATQKKVRMLSDGHTPVTVGSTKYAYEEGQKEQRIEFSYKNMKDELEKQISAELEMSGLVLSDIERVDLILGGDHGAGAFQFGVKVVIASKKSVLTFDIAVAEVICKKDNAEVLKLTVEQHLTEGISAITKETLTFGYGSNGDMACFFGSCDGLTSRCAPAKDVWFTGDLAFYAMVLGRESSSGTRCYLCRMSAKEFTQSLQAGEAWSYDTMNELVGKMKRSGAKNPKPIEGCKELAWWQMVPLNHYLVPLLHTLIGIGNDIYDNFRDVVNESIECLDRKEIEARRKVAECELAIESDKMCRNEWDASEKGKKLESLKGVIYRRNKILKDLGYTDGSPLKVVAAKLDDIDELLKEYDEYVAGDDTEGMDYEEGNADGDAMMLVPGDIASAAAGASNDEVASALRRKVEEYLAIIRKSQQEMIPLLAERAVFEKRVSTGKKLLARLKKKLTEFRSVRKKSNDGIESQFLDVLKSIGVELTRYHGGSLAGTDIKKVIANADYLFDEFAIILKSEGNRKEDSPMSDADIDRFCETTKHLFQLWDGAFALARKISPTDDDCELYLQYVQAAVDCHVKFGCNITHKVHLMLVHVYLQMKTVPRGLGEKMEDWVELQHQIGSRRRRQFRTMKDLQRRASAAARAEQRSKNADVLAQIAAVTQESKRQLTSTIDKTTAAERRRARRQEMRAEALSTYNLHKKKEKEAAAMAIASFVRKRLMGGHRS